MNSPSAHQYQLENDGEEERQEIKVGEGDREKGKETK